MRELMKWKTGDRDIFPAAVVNRSNKFFVFLRDNPVALRADL